MEGPTFAAGKGEENVFTVLGDEFAGGKQGEGDSRGGVGSGDENDVAVLLHENDVISTNGGGEFEA